MMLAPFMDNRLAVECLLVHVDIDVDISSPWVEVEEWEVVNPSRLSMTYTC